MTPTSDDKVALFLRSERESCLALPALRSAAPPRVRAELARPDDAKNSPTRLSFPPGCIGILLLSDIGPASARVRGVLVASDERLSVELSQLDLAELSLSSLAYFPNFDHSTFAYLIINVHEYRNSRILNSSQILKFLLKLPSKFGNKNEPPQA